MTKKIILSLIVLFCLSGVLRAEEYGVFSPDKKLEVRLRVDGQTMFEVWYNREKMVASSAIGMHLSDGRTVGADAVTSVKKKRVNGKIDVVVGKNKTLKESYNEIVLSYGKDYDLVVRAYNEGWAYRFVTHLNKEIIINKEDAEFNFAFTPTVYFPECDANTAPEREQSGKVHQIHQGYRNFERLYKVYKAPGEIPEGRFSVSPVLFEYPGKPYKIVVTESDTYDYPGLYMEVAGQNAMRGKWAAYPKGVMDGDPSNPHRWYSNHLVITREDYIARTQGERTFPWRVMIVTDEDKNLLNNELVYMLAEPCKLEDTSWIRPGKSAWEWWHKAVVEGVDFPVGNKHLSLPLYKYYVDWASDNGIEYMTLDAGWKMEYIRELCDYARQKNVKILVWTWASCPLENPNDWIKQMHECGVAGAKIDFFERNDQIAMRWEREFAERLAEYKMVAVFHGCPVPVGLNRTYPNVMNYEAVRGAECNYWEKTITPEYHTRFPFIRSLAGPEDYTPGGMRNVTPEEFRPMDIDSVPPMNMGTRAHIMSMYVIFDHWVGYLCDAPSEYDKCPDILDYLSSVPTVWDRTLPLDARLGEYIVMAKQTGKNWFVGGMTNWTPRSVTVDFGFLKRGKSYRAMILKDKPESGDYPKQYASETVTVDRNTKLTLDMARGGGFAIRLVEE